MYQHIDDQLARVATTGGSDTHNQLEPQSGSFQSVGDSRPVRCAIYARSAVADIETLSTQIKACDEAARSEGWIVVDSYIKSDCGVSGLYWAGLGGLEALLIAAETQSRPFDRLLVTDWSRLSRNRDVARRIIKAFAFYGVPIFSVQDSEIIDESLRHLPDFHHVFRGGRA